MEIPKCCCWLGRGANCEVAWLARAESDAGITGLRIGARGQGPELRASLAWLALVSAPTVHTSYWLPVTSSFSSPFSPPLFSERRVLPFLSLSLSPHHYFLSLFPLLGTPCSSYGHPSMRGEETEGKNERERQKF